MTETGTMAAIIPALVAAVVAGLGWFVGASLTRRREDRTRRLQLTIEQAEKQVSDFYSPLIFLIEQLDAIYRIKDAMVKACPNKKNQIDDIAYAEHFLPTHREIATLLKTKIHLLEGRAVPPSLLDYIYHFTSENIARQLKRDGIDVWSQVTTFPSEFFDHLQHDRTLVYMRYQSALAELRHNLVFQRPVKGEGNHE